MLLEKQQVSVRSSGLGQTTKFRAKLDGLMFDNLINGIYSNKIGAGIREYSTNARDGHARRGNLDVPFEVHLPTRATPTFSVRDFGSSLTHDEVFNIFVVLGESTKRETNDETGCLGLGSKSAFAYTTSFNVTCWLNGEKRDYVCYKDAEGEPALSQLSKVKSNEPQGLRVSYSVKAEDVVNFNKEATLQLRGFDPMPKIVAKTEDFKSIIDQELLMEGPDWKVYKTVAEGYYGRESGKPMAIQGSVSYPINRNNTEIQAAMFDWIPSTKDKVNRLLTATDINIKFAIGQINMTTSREELQYDKKTCLNIVNKCKAIVEEIEATLDKKYENCQTLKEARMLYAKTKLSGREGIDYILNINYRKWRGHILEAQMDICGSENDGLIGESESKNNYSYNNSSYKMSNSVVGHLRIETDSHYQNKFGEYKASFNWRPVSNKNARVKESHKCDEIGNRKVLVEIESKVADMNNNELMRRFWKDKMHHTDWGFLWIRVPSKVEAEKFLEIIYHDKPENVFYLHEMTPLKMPKTTTASGTVVPKSSTEKRMRYLESSSNAWSSEANKYEVIDFTTLTEKLPVIFFKNNAFYWTEKDMELELNGMKFIDIPPIMKALETPKLYVINGSVSKYYEDNPNYFEMGKETMIENWKKANPQWETNYMASVQEKDNQEEGALKRTLKVLATKHSIHFKGLGDYISDAPAHISQYYNTKNLQYNLQQWLKPDLEALELKAKAKAVETRLVDMVKKDPVLNYLLEQVSDYHNTEELVAAIKSHVTKNY